MPVPKPTDLTPWATSATGLANSTQPTSGQSADGWAVAQKPPSQYFNWLQNRYGQWINWLNDITNQLFTWAGLQTFSDGILSNAPATANRAGVASTGNGTGAGGDFTGGATGPGVKGTGAGTSKGGTFANGTAATATTRQDAASLTNGDLDLSAVANPNSNVSLVNRLTPKNIIKAWARVVISNGVASIVDGVNVASVSTDANFAYVNFVGAFANTNYGITVTPYGVGTTSHWMDQATANTASQAIVASLTSAGVSIVPNGAGSSYGFTITCVGAQ